MMKDDYLPSYVIDPSNLQLKEYVRKEGIVFYPVKVYAGKNNLFSIKLHHGGKFTPSPKRMYVRGKANYVDNIDVDLFNVDELHMFIQDLGYDPSQLMFYHYKMPNKMYVEIEELDDDVLLNAPVVGSSKRLALGWNNEVHVRESSVGKNDKVNVVGSSKRLALGWINEADVGESSVGKNDNVNVDGNVHEEQIVNLNDYTIDENMNENVNVDGNVDENMNENVNADDENVDADDEYEHGVVEDEEVIGNDREDFIMDEEHVVDEVEVNMEGFTFSVQEQGPEQTITPNIDLTDEALEVLDFDSFDSYVGDDTVSIIRRSVRKLRKSGGQSTGIVNTLFMEQEFPNKESAKARIKAYVVETRRKIRIVKNDSERL
ncbi:hypothetical protein Tco_0536857 [Tanacetum coccineum]